VIEAAPREKDAARAHETWSDEARSDANATEATADHTATIYGRASHPAARDGDTTSSAASASRHGPAAVPAVAGVSAAAVVLARICRHRHQRERRHEDGRSENFAHSHDSGYYRNCPAKSCALFLAGSRNFFLMLECRRHLRGTLSHEGRTEVLHYV
jgi:hypothetical protein